MHGLLSLHPPTDSYCTTIFALASSHPYASSRVIRTMEVKIPRPGDSSKSGDGGKKPPSRLQKRAPATLLVESKAAQGASPSPSWGDTAAAGGSTPIPFLSPLVLSPAPLWDVKDSAVSKSEDDKKGGDDGGEIAQPTSPSEGWCHPALLVSAAMEPASLVPLFEFQCSM